MQPNQYFPDPGRGQFNTLAQNGTEPYINTSIVVNGNGSELSNLKALKGRAKRKLITQTMMLKLIEVAEADGSETKKKSYWNTYHCQNRVYTANNRLYGKYCKNRFCTLCCSIRKAEIINKYYPFIRSWEAPYFVTLTIRSINQTSLPKFLKGMNQAFNKIYSKHKKRSQRNGSIKLMGLRSLECNFNPITKKYNPHFHIIVSSKEGAEILVNEWQNLWTPKWTNRRAQHFSPANNTQELLIEIIKYGSKIFTEPDLKKKGRDKGNSRIHIGALDNIFDSMKGMRIFERFGFNLPGNEQSKIPAKVIRQFIEWEFSLHEYDWIDNQGKKLSNFVPLKEMINLLENRVDVDLK